MERNFKEYIVTKKTVEERLAENGFKNLPENILEYIKDSKQGIISIDELPETLRIGNGNKTIKKVLLEGNVAKEGFEIGMLAIPEGEGIKSHNHLKDGEKYMVITDGGSFKIIGEKEQTRENTCGIRGNHGIEPGQEDIVILNIKVAEEIINEIDWNEITPEKIFSKEVQTKLKTLSNKFKNRIKSEEEIAL